MDSQLANRTTALQIALGATAALAGLDKFFNVLADWPAYLSPLAVNILPISADAFMQLVGVIEVGVGFCILFAAPILGAYVASVWLSATAVNLVLSGYFDVAVRDVVLAVAAFGLARALELRALPRSDEQRARPHRREVLST